MWRFKQFMPKDQAGLEGRSIELNPSFKLQVRNVIAEGGFSSVYLAKEAQTGKSYALKHIICNDMELVELVRKEVAVMKSLQGHPNVVTLHAHAVFDTGRTKECFLAMDFCEKTLVQALESRGAGYYEEKQLLLIFRDICNAVCGMHSQSPPIAHRDLKLENVLLGSDGLWKLCDFGSTSTDHKKFEKPEEMGVEEDTIRKHTTPAYRAPEMWDLFQRERISEKVDIWALGCLLYRLAFFKSAFDGESKLQILNGNYRIPDAPRYTDCVVQLIKDMLTASPEARPDIMQVWRRVNGGLPSEYRKTAPDRASSSPVNNSSVHETSEPRTSSVKPTRSPPAPPPHSTLQSIPPVKGGGSFWATQFAAEPKHEDDTSSSRPSSASQSNITPPSWSARFEDASSSQRKSVSPIQQQARSTGESVLKPGDVFKKAAVENTGRKLNAEKVDGAGTGKAQGNGFQAPVGGGAKVPEVSSDGAFNAFVAEFDSTAQQASEIERLKQQLKQALAEKEEFAGKYEKLTAICRSQRQEIQELKSALASSCASTNPPKETMPKPPQSRRTRLEWNSPSDQGNKEKQNGSVWELPTASNSTDSWQEFGDRPASTTKAAADGNGRRQHARAASVSGSNTWGFIQETMNNSSPHGLDSRVTASHGGGSTSFRAPTTTDSAASALRSSSGSKSQHKPAGWAGF